MSELSGRFSLPDLLECAGLARSTYYYALAHPRRPTRPELWDAAREIFSRTPNGCGHRQVAMCLRAERGARIADKTALKMMGEMGLRCGIRRETDYHRYNSYRGPVGETFENVLGRDFASDGPWRKMGTDVTEFRCSFGKAYLAPVYDFGSREIAAWSISESPDMAQQEEMLDMLISRMPEGARPVLQSDMGWQYQSAEHVAQGQLPGQRLHRGAVRPHEGRVLPRSRLGRLRVVQGGPRGLHSPLEHSPQAEGTEGTDPGGVPRPVLDGGLVARFN